MEKKITPYSRVQEYPDEFEVLNGILMCKWCNKAVNYIETKTIKDHISGKKHLKLKLSENPKRQSQLSNFISSNVNQETIEDFIQMMAQNNIPYEKVDSMR